MIELPDGLPLPSRCPECGGEWTGHGHTLTGPPAVTLVCRSGHEHRQQVTEMEMMRWRLTMDPDSLFDVPVWVVGETGPIPDITMSPNTVGDRPFSINRRRYVIDAVEEDRIWVRPVD